MEITHATESQICVDRCISHIDSFYSEKELLCIKKLQELKYYAVVCHIASHDSNSCVYNHITDIIFRLKQAIIDLAHCVRYMTTIKYGESLVQIYKELVKVIIIELYDTISENEHIKESYAEFRYLVNSIF